MTVASVAFALVGLFAFVGAVFTVRSKKLVHAVLWLGVTLAMTAVLFVQLGAPFLAGMQLLLYVGGVMTLMIFGVLLTHKDGDGDLKSDPASKQRGALVALAVFSVLAGTIWMSASTLHSFAPPSEGRIGELGRSLLTQHLVAFEVLSVLLLAAMIGAVVIARRRDPDEPVVSEFSSPLERSAEPELSEPTTRAGALAGTAAEHQPMES